MILLTRDEIEQVIKTTDGPKSEWMQYVCRAIEAAVIKRLAGVSVEPVGHLDGTDYLAEFMSMGLRAQHDAGSSHTPKSYKVPVYSAEAIKQHLGEA